ncbi:MAG: lamin tail domain-containing protein [Myxococcales bacterium]|nr:lamin tail domain-containing protein [Myxococcales bacterium]
MTYRTTRWLPVLGLGAASLMACSSPKDEAPVAKSSQAVSTTLVISQAYGGGGSGSAGTAFKYDYVEITNIGTASASLGGLSLQYTSGTGPSSGGWQKFDLPAVTLGAGKRYLIQIGTSAGAAGADLPTPDAINTAFSMGGSSGKVALVNGVTALTCGTAAARCATTSWIDMLGYGGSSDYEGTSLTGTITTALSFVRKGNGCTDTDNNQADFDIVASTPHNTADPAISCGGDAGSDVGGDTSDAADVADASDGADGGADATDGAADAADSGAADSGAADSGAADTTVADTTVADTTVADTTVADTTVADTTAADTTAADSTAADSADDTTPPEDTGTAPADTGTAPSDTGSASDTGTDGGTIAPPETEADSGCGCATPGTSSSDRTTQGALAAVLVAGLLARRRRR